MVVVSGWGPFEGPARGRPRYPDRALSPARPQGHPPAAMHLRGPFRQPRTLHRGGDLRHREAADAEHLLEDRVRDTAQLGRLRADSPDRSGHWIHPFRHRHPSSPPPGVLDLWPDRKYRPGPWSLRPDRSRTKGVHGQSHRGDLPRSMPGLWSPRLGERVARSTILHVKVRVAVIGPN